MKIFNADVIRFFEGILCILLQCLKILLIYCVAQIFLHMTPIAKNKNHMSHSILPQATVLYLFYIYNNNDGGGAYVTKMWGVQKRKTIYFRITLGIYALALHSLTNHKIHSSRLSYLWNSILLLLLLTMLFHWPNFSKGWRKKSFCSYEGLW